MHGGIPSLTHCDGSLDALDDIPVPLSDPEIESPLAWEIMWSDPVNSSYQVYFTTITMPHANIG